MARDAILSPSPTLIAVLIRCQIVSRMDLSRVKAACEWRCGSMACLRESERVRNDVAGMRNNNYTCPCNCAFDLLFLVIPKLSFRAIIFAGTNGR